MKYGLVLYFVLRGRVYLPWIEVILNVIWRSWESQDFNRCDGFTLFLQYTWTKKYRFIHELQLCLVGIMLWDLFQVPFSTCLLMGYVGRHLESLSNSSVSPNSFSHIPIAQFCFPSVWSGNDSTSRSPNILYWALYETFYVLQYR